jgi:hypothetical protein
LGFANVPVTSYAMSLQCSTMNCGLAMQSLICVFRFGYLAGSNQIYAFTYGR